MDGWSFSSLGSGVVALEGVDTEAPSAGAGGADGAASLAGAFVLQCGGGGVDGGASSFAGALVGDAMGDLYSPSAVAFGGVQGESFAVAFETSVVDGDQHGAVTGSQFVDMTDLESRPFMPVPGLVATEAVKEWRSGVTVIDAGYSPPPSVWQGGNVLVPLVRVGEIEAGAGEEPEEEVDPHEDISQVAKFLQGQEAGSHRSRELHADVREAEVLWNWLASSHEDWLDAKGVSRIVCASTRKDQSILFFARKGRSFCAKARRAVICYERFVAANASRINCGGSQCT